MMRLAMSTAARSLLRALIARSGADENRILLTEWTSIDWQSLTFIGERHEARMRICGPDADAILAKVIADLDDADFKIPGHVLADIAVTENESDSDGSRMLLIEALTLRDD